MTKYRAIPTTVDGIRFASKKEAARYGQLKLMEKAGEISELCTQTKYPLTVGGTTVATYIADFTYRKQGSTVVEDVKGVLTPVYRLKKKLMLAIWGIKIQEV